MIWVLKVIFLILLTIDFLVFRLLLTDWKNTKKTVNYENSSIMDRMKINGISWFVFAVLLIFAVFLIYFMISEITVTPIWES